MRGPRRSGPSTTVGPRDFSLAIAARDRPHRRLLPAVRRRRLRPPATRSPTTTHSPTLGPHARAGLHVRPVTLHENVPEDVARGAKRMEVEGLAKPLAARVMALAARWANTPDRRRAQGARRHAARGHPIESHGHYRLKGVEAPVEIFELGVPGAARSLHRRMPTRRTAWCAQATSGARCARCATTCRPSATPSSAGAGAARARARLDGGARLAHRPRPGRHRQDPFRPPLRLDVARRLAGRRLLLRLERGPFSTGSSSRRLRARGPAGQGRSRRATRPRHCRPRPLLSHPR